MLQMDILDENISTTTIAQKRKIASCDNMPQWRMWLWGFSQWKPAIKQAFQIERQAVAHLLN